MDHMFGYHLELVDMDMDTTTMRDVIGPFMLLELRDLS